MSEEPKESEQDGWRDLLAAAAAGVLAASGLVAGLLAGEGEAGAAVSTPALSKATAAGGQVPLAESRVLYEKLRNGHSVELASTELTNVLVREGLISNELLGKQVRMKLQFLYAP